MILVGKFKRSYRAKLVSYFRSKSYYPKLYKSYWHYRFNKNVISSSSFNYYTAIPNPGAGIGHQMANWIAGYWFAQQFGLQFAHIPFLSSKWDFFLGFGQEEKKTANLLRDGYKKVRLPLFDEFNNAQVLLQKDIIASYCNKKVVFVAEQDQGYKDQYGVIESIQEKFHNAAARKKDAVIFESNNLNIAIHVRRGDIVIGQENQNANLLMRWQANDYFVKVLENVLNGLETNKPIAIYLFSQGVESDFIEFSQFKNLHFCLDMNAQDSFLHMVFADLLISSKSSFSYKPSLLNRGVKVCPEDFWHGYPDADDWVMVNNDGVFKKSNTIRELK
ncbi:hypothetical protein FQU23_007700 [Flavobacterium sp. XN-5]|nr:hypothetical protein [Flavobacterium sp. XN-5]